MEFLTVYKQTIIFTIIVLAVFLTLRFLTQQLHATLEKRFRKKHPGEEPIIIHLIQKILNALWIVLGIMALAYIFIDEEQFKGATRNIFIILYIGIVAVVTLVIASLTQTWFKRSIEDKITQNQDPTSYYFLRYLAIFAVHFIGIVLASLALPLLKGVAQTALGGAGVLAVIAGIASQEALANLVGGLFIISFKPFRIGDIIKLDETKVGTVTDITLRNMVIKNYQNKMIVIPNSFINREKLVDYDLGDRMCCQWIEVGISYSSDIDLAKHIMREECEVHPNLIDYRTEFDKYKNVKKVIVRIISLGESAVTIRAWAWAANFKEAFEMKCDLYESIKKRFEKEGIDIPFPHRTMVFKENKMEFLKFGLSHEVRSSEAS
ncbi:mechanosensitive ion channel family protein [Algoriphagus pacificus]|uniref:Mechanosensitive ion channel family protein n=1 Tax=Algoriphagus pacificus TaxID=2811234 RepID=A0ABS3CKR0_9BACT|nr:mechanosensitive ion channel family protein [Algoriphagus pacificus]MBN7817685.1 mechanosensitive ion channel family protein [Algoriphagus pacificus]